MAHFSSSPKLQMFILTDLVSGAGLILSWTWIETTMLMIALVGYALWTGSLLFGGAATSLKGKEEDEEGQTACKDDVEQVTSQNASLKRAHALRCERLQRQREVMNDVQKLSRSGSLISKQMDLDMSTIVCHNRMVGCRFGQWHSPGMDVNAGRLMWTMGVKMSGDNPLGVRQPHICKRLFAVPSIAQGAEVECLTDGASQCLMRWPSMSSHGHSTSQPLTFEVLQLQSRQCIPLMRVTLNFPIQSALLSWMPSGMNHANTRLMLMNQCSAVAECSMLNRVEDAQGHEDAAAMYLASDTSEPHRLELHDSESALNPSLEASDCTNLKISFGTNSDCSSAPAFIRQPDGSLMLLAHLDDFESPPHTPSTEEPTATFQLRETARALRNAVEREIAADKLRRAAVRQGLLRKILISQLLVNFVSGVVCVCCSTPYLTPQDWEVSVYFLLMLWWVCSISTCIIGVAVVHSARERVFSFLSALALAGAAGQMWLACAVMNALYPEGPPTVIIGALSVLWDLPLRLAVGSQAWLVQIDLRYLLLVRPDVFTSIDSFGMHHA